MDAQELKVTLLDLKSRLEDIKVNVFQIEDKKKRLEEIENELIESEKKYNAINQNIKDIQINYQRLRQKRIQFVAKSSFNQGKLNHLKHPLLIFLRNYLMKNTQIIKYMTNKIWNYRPYL